MDHKESVVSGYDFDYPILKCDMLRLNCSQPTEILTGSRTPFCVDFLALAWILSILDDTSNAVRVSSSRKERPKVIVNIFWLDLAITVGKQLNPSLTDVSWVEINQVLY